MGYLNTSIMKRASLAALLGTAGALGATGGGLAGHYGSDKTDNTLSTVLGALGGGAGAAAGMAGVNYIPRLEGLNSKLSEAVHSSRKVTKLDRILQALAGKPAKTFADKMKASQLHQARNTLNILAHENAPKWVRSLAKSSPKLRNALLLGTLGLGAATGGTLGALLGVKGGDALA